MRRVGEAIGAGETEAEGALQVGVRLRGVTAVWATSHVGCCGGSEAPPAASAANLAHRSRSRRVLRGQAMRAHWAYGVHYGWCARSSVSSSTHGDVREPTRAERARTQAAIGASGSGWRRARAARSLRSASRWPSCQRLAVESVAFIQPTLGIPNRLSHGHRLAAGAGGGLERGGMSSALSSNGTEPGVQRTRRAASVDSAQDAKLADCIRRSRLAPTIAQLKAPPLSSKARNVIDAGADTVPALARCFVRAPAACVGVSHAS